MSQTQITVQISRKRIQEGNKVARTTEKGVLPGWTWEIICLVKQVRERKTNIVNLLHVESKK